MIRFLARRWHRVSPSAGPAFGASASCASGERKAARGRIAAGETFAIAILAAIAAALAILSIGIGPAKLDPLAVIQALAGDGDKITQLIVWEVRLPRAILGLAIGATLGIAGAAIQGFARNPLASPDILGIPSFAALGAVAVIHFGASGVFSLAVPAAAIASAFLGTLLLFLLAGRDSRMLTLVLAGLALASLAGALTSLALSLAPNPFAVTEIAFWLLGSLSGRSFQHVWLGLPFMAASWLIFLAQRRVFLALSLGEDAALSLGVSLRSARLWLAAGIACGVGASVAVAGGIGFIGLMAPHMVRPFFGYDPSRILVPSALAGAVLLTAGDVAIRIIPATAELRVGVATALIGVPFFLALILRERRGGPAFE